MSDKKNRPLFDLDCSQLLFLDEEDEEEKGCHIEIDLSVMAHHLDGRLNSIENLLSEILCAIKDNVVIGAPKNKLVI